MGGYSFSDPFCILFILLCVPWGWLEWAPSVGFLSLWLLARFNQCNWKNTARRTEWVIRVRLVYLFFIMSVPSLQDLYGLPLSFSQRSQLHSFGPIHTDLFLVSTTTSSLSPLDNGVPLLLTLEKWFFFSLTTTFKQSSNITHSRKLFWTLLQKLDLLNRSFYNGCISLSP